MNTTEAEAFTAGQAANAAGIVYHQLNHWALMGVVVPSVGEGKGYAGVRAYSFADIVALKVIDRMKESGFALRKLRGLAAAIQKWDKSSSKTFFVCDESGDVGVYGEHEALAALSMKDRRVLTWCVNIRDVAEDVRSQLQLQTRSTRGKSLRT